MHNIEQNPQYIIPNMYSRYYTTVDHCLTIAEKVIVDGEVMTKSLNFPENCIQRVANVLFKDKLSSEFDDWFPPSMLHCVSNVYYVLCILFLECTVVRIAVNYVIDLLFRQETIILHHYMIVGRSRVKVFLAGNATAVFIVLFNYN